MRRQTMKIFAVSAFALATVIAGSAAAQTQQVTHGPAIPNVCTFHNARMLAQSTSGQALSSGMERLVQEVQAEVAPYTTSIQTEATALQQGGQAADADGSRRRALQARAQELEQLTQRREQELQYTRAVQLQAIATAADPIVVAVYQERQCGILLDRDSIFIANPSMDITDTVIQRLNTALPSLSFSRMTPPVQQPQ